MVYCIVAKYESFQLSSTHGLITFKTVATGLLLHMCVHVQLAPLSVLDMWSWYGYHLSIIFPTHSTYFSV